MSYDDENRQWAWDELKKSKAVIVDLTTRLRDMTAIANSHKECAHAFARRLRESDNPVDFEKELKEAALYRKIKRVQRVSGLR